MLSEEQKKRIISKLIERVPNLKCPICNGQSFSILDGFISNNVQDSISNYFLGSGPRTISVAIICTHCGFSSYHNIGVLGITDDNDNNEKEG